MQLTPYWTPLKYHPTQSALWTDPQRIKVAVAGRGSGKTELARRRTVIHLAIKKPWPNPVYIYALPTYAQAKKVAWTPLLNLIPDSWINDRRRDINISDQTIRTKFGSTLYVVGLDQPHRIEGLQIDGIVVDESSDQKPGVFDLTILPMLSHRSAWVWRIGVPKRAGIGRPEFKSVYERGTDGTDPDLKAYWWKSEDILTEEQIRIARRTLDPQDYAEQFEASWVDMGGTVYYAFSKDNVSEDARYDPSKSIIIGADFNVSPMSWCLGHFDNGHLFIFDEIFLKNTNTTATIKHLAEKYGNHEAGFKFFCDASSRQRRTSAARSDYLILKEFGGLKNKQVYFPKKNPHLQDRFATVNAALCNAEGELRVHINPRCKKLINDMYNVAYREGTTEVENYTGTDIGHMADAFGYAIMKLMPLKLTRPSVPSIISIVN